ncbi:MAG TPA: KpsF/GutQ family sugar-phosphate isomerase [Terriglobales bacterium]|nr:KpsF/GutQ family sugar-phosphate isomerase [Terriglobales bacterium]
MPDSSSIQATARRVLEVEAAAVQALSARVGVEFERAVQLVMACSGRVVITGMGKSGIVARKIAATLSSTGTPSLFLHPAEALHGDLGMLVRGDVVVALSQSGETAELLNLLGPLKRIGIPMIALTGAPESLLARNAEVHLDVGVSSEACPLGLAPTASTTAALALGDALAMAVAEQRGFTPRDFAELHPGGKLGKRLTPVSELMHSGDALPRVAPGTLFPEVVYEMSRKGFGVAAVVEPDGSIAGLISDGDIRRLFQAHGAAAVSRPAQDCMTRNPVLIAPHELAPAALLLMEGHRITALLVAGADRKLQGLVHLHDLWTTELI